MLYNNATTIYSARINLQFTKRWLSLKAHLYHKCAEAFNADLTKSYLAAIHSVSLCALSLSVCWIIDVRFSKSYIKQDKWGPWAQRFSVRLRHLCNGWEAQCLLLLFLTTAHHTWMGTESAFVSVTQRARPRTPWHMCSLPAYNRVVVVPYITSACYYHVREHHHYGHATTTVTAYLYQHSCTTHYCRDILW